MVQFIKVVDHGEEFLIPLLVAGKGASKEEKRLAGEQAKTAGMQAEFFKVMQDSYKEQFAGQKAILEMLTKTWEPILAAGPGQEGFTQAEKTAINTQISEGTGREYAKASKAMREEMAARGGPNGMAGSAVPSGADEQILAGIAQQGAEKSADLRTQTVKENFARGHDTWLKASSVLGNAAGLYNAAGFAGESTSAGNAAMQGAGQATSAAKDAARGWSGWGTIGGIVGGAAGSFLGPMGTSMGSSIGKKMGGG